jgi:plasmid stabilization system protein ParE
MKSGYSVFWTDHALSELDLTIEYLGSNFSDVEVARLSRSIETTVADISRNPLMYPRSEKSGGIRRAVVLRFNTLYYRVSSEDRRIEVLSFFSNRKDPEALAT